MRARKLSTFLLAFVVTAVIAIPAMAAEHIPASWRTGLSSTGTQRVLAICIDFPDCPAPMTAGDVERRLDGEQDAGDAAYPCESLRAFYQRSSFGKLDLRTDVVGWYDSPVPRAEIAATSAGREQLIAGALRTFAAEGLDLARYDSDRDGKVDYLMVFWAGPADGRSGFWTPATMGWGPTPIALDGVTVDSYSWQSAAGLRTGARTAIHETGHALGLPDLYDADKSSGPLGGVGGLDMMDGGVGDFNAFSKWLLGWIEPTFVREADLNARLRPSATSGDAIVVMPDASAENPFSECFVIENRENVGNDFGAWSDAHGVVIWHVDARLDAAGANFAMDDSHSAHKLVALVQADGRGDIERGWPADSGDVWRQGRSFNASSVPSSARYDGGWTGVTMDSVSYSGTTATLRAYVEGTPGAPRVASGLPAARPGVPAVPSFVGRGRSFMAAGSLLPSQPGMAKSVTLTFARLESGRWVSRKSVRAIVAENAAGSWVYRARVSLPSVGTWRVRASLAQAGRAPSRSAWRGLKVRR